MAVDPYAGLSPQERKLWGLDGDKGAPGSAPSAPAPTTTAAPAAPPAGSDAPATGILPALAGGAVHGAGDVVNAPMAWIGGPQFDASGVYSAAQQQHPWAAGIGRFAGQLGTAGAALFGGELAFPEIGAGALAARIATNPLLRAGAAGAISGAEQNLLTAGENPNENLGHRAFWGGVGGAAGGLVAGKLGSAFGKDVALASPEVGQAAQTAQGAGVTDIGLANLPQAGGAAAAKGAVATVPQAQQVTQAFTGNILGENVPDLGAANLQPMLQRLGQNVGNAAAQGQVHFNLIEPELNRIEADATQASGQVIPAVKRALDEVRGKVANGVISGSDMQSLIQHNSVLDRATRNLQPEIASPANEIEEALKDGFTQSSSQGVADAYSQARGKYKLGLALENNVAMSGVNGHTLINPATIYSTLRQGKWLGKDITRLGTGTGMFDQAVNLAKASDMLYGGGTAAAGASSAPSWVAPLSLGSLGGAASWAMHNPIPAAGAAGLWGLNQGARMLGRWYQGRPAFVNRLIQTGTGAGPVVNQLTSPTLAGRGVVSALPTTASRP